MNDDDTVFDDDQVPAGLDVVATSVPDSLDPAEDADGGEPPEPQTEDPDFHQEG